MPEDVTLPGQRHRCGHPRDRQSGVLGGRHTHAHTCTHAPSLESHTLNPVLSGLSDTLTCMWPCTRAPQRCLHTGHRADSPTHLSSSENIEDGPQVLLGSWRSRGRGSLHGGQRASQWPSGASSIHACRPGGSCRPEGHQAQLRGCGLPPQAAVRRGGRGGQAPEPGQPEGKA